MHFDNLASLNLDFVTTGSIIAFFTYRHVVRGLFPLVVYLGLLPTQSLTFVKSVEVYVELLGCVLSCP